MRHLYTLCSVLLLCCWTVSAELLLRNSTTVAGRYGSAGSTDGPIATATLSSPKAVCVDSQGVVYIGDNELIRSLQDGVVTTLFGVSGVFGNTDGNRSTALVNVPTSMIELDAFVYFAEPRNNQIRRFNRTDLMIFSGGNGTGLGGFQDGPFNEALFVSPSSIAYSALNDVWYVADTGNSKLRSISRAGDVTTVLTILSPFYVTAAKAGTLYLLNRPTSSSVGVFVFFAQNGTGYQWIAAATLALVSLGYDNVNQRLFGASQNRIVELLPNGTLSLIAGSGSAYLDGPNPRFNYVTNLFVETFRSMYITSGPLAYVVRRLFFDPPPPIPVVISFSYPQVFPIDNMTALNATMDVLEAIANMILGTNTSTFVDRTSMRFDATTITTNFTIFVQNESYTNATAAMIQGGNYSVLFDALRTYYRQTNYSVLLDPLVVPPIAVEWSNATTTTAVTNMLLEEVRRVLQYAHIFFESNVPSDVVNASDQGSLRSWRLLLPASFANATTTALLSSLLHSDITAFITSICMPNVYTFLPDATVVLPFSNATAMRSVRLSLQADVQRAIQFQPVGVLPATSSASLNGTVFSILIPSFWYYANTTAAQLVSNLTNATLVSLDQFLSQYYPVARSVEFDASRFPWSDEAAVSAIRTLMTKQLNLDLGGNSASTAVQLGLDIIVNTTTRLVSYSVYVPASIESAVNVSAILASESFPTVTAYIAQYYKPSTLVYKASFNAFDLPVYNATAMNLLRLAIGDDLAIALDFSNVGANVSTPSFTASTTSPLTPTTVVRFPLLIPPSLVNTNTTDLINQITFTSVEALLQSLFYSNTSVLLDVGQLPVGNATAMEQLRQLLSSTLRTLLGNATNSSNAINIMPGSLVNVTQSDGTNVSNVLFVIRAPVGTLDGVNVSQLVQSFSNLLTAPSPSNPINQFVSSYYPQNVYVTLPYDITPWSNSTVMNQLQSAILVDVHQALASVTSLTSPISINFTSMVVSRSNRTVTLQLLVPPSIMSSTTSANITLSSLQSISWSATSTYLNRYFPTNVTVSMEANSLPWSDAAAMAIVSRLLSDYLADNVFLFQNIGVNGTTVQSGTVVFKIIVPPNFANATTWNITRDTTNVLLASGSTNISAVIPELSSFLGSYFPQDYYATFANGVLPTSNRTAMLDILALLNLDLQNLLQYSNVAAGEDQSFTDNNTGASYIRFPLFIPPSFANSTTDNLLVTATYSRVAAYVAAYYATPAPPTPAPAFVFTSSWPLANLPTGNETQMEMLRQAMLQDVENVLHVSSSDVTVSSWTTSVDGQNGEFVITLPVSYNNASTGVTLQDTNSYPIFQQLLASLTLGNLQSISAVSSSVNEGCSRGCVIGVACVAALVATGGIVAAVMLTSKRRQTTVSLSHAAPKFTPVFDEKNPLDIA